ncbi:MAG: LLM class flavin-dependent oxidoreductase [Thermomicrobiales bacterium]
MELGLYSFADVTPDAITGATISPAQRLRDLIEEIELADQVGLDVFGVGEHHRPDYAVSAPAVVLAAAAERTSHIRLSSAVTVLSSDDPVRVFQQFSTLDLLSGGRAEIMVGRGSFIESFPLFGYDLNDYDDLFIEKLELLLKIRENERVTWSGKLRAPIDNQGVYPRPLQNSLLIWVGVGGNPGSAVRAGVLGLPMALAIIGGLTPNMLPLVEYYREGARQAGRDPGQLPISINSHGYIAESRQQAIDEWYPSYEQAMTKLGKERGWSKPSRSRFETELTLKGAQFVGAPEQVIEKILYQHELFGHQRFLLQFSLATMPHAKIMKSIELFGTKVAPVVRAEVAKRTPTSLSANGII